MLFECTECHKSVEGLLNTKTNDVICPECSGVISNISESMKRTLKSFGRIIRESSPRVFIQPCFECKADREVVLEGDKVMCRVCKNEVKVRGDIKKEMMGLQGSAQDTERPKIQTGTKVPKKPRQ